MLSARWFWCAIAVAILAGVALRVEHIERRSFWADESWTALRISGHTYTELRKLFDGRVHPVSAVLRFQRVDPRRGAMATVSGLATEEPQHPPVFYVLDRWWAALAGSSIPALRAPALLFGVAAIAAIAWFAFELSGDALIAGAAAGLMAVSPFFVNYSGQAREYTLWALFVAVTSALLLRAVRGGAPWIWVAYGAAMTVALYSDVLMLCVLAAHALFVVARYAKERRILVPFFVAAAASVLLFVPWIAVCVHQMGKVWGEQTWTRTAYPPRLMLEKWAFNIGSVLFDAEYASMRLAAVAALALALVLYAVYRLIRDEARATTWLLASLGALVALPQLAVDLAVHGHSSTESRYLVPLWMALLLCVAFFLGRRLAGTPGNVRASALALSCAVLLAATASCVVNSSAVSWWDNDDDYPSMAIASQIGRASEPPLVVSEGWWAEVLVLSHYVPASTRFLLFKHRPPFPLALKGPAFLLAPSPATLAAFRSDSAYRLTPLPIASPLSAAQLSFRRAVERSAGTPALSPRTFLFRLTPSGVARARTTATRRGRREDRSS